MKVTYKKKIKWYINTVYDIEKLIIETKRYKTFKSFDKTKYELIQNDINNTEIITYKEIFDNIIKKYITEISNFRIDYWIQRGYTKENAIANITLYQKRNNLCYYSKYNKKERKNFNVKCVEYWMIKGYTYDEAKYKISKLQNNNSVESISKSLNCSLEEAKDIQKNIYSKRLNTMNSKTDCELKAINKRKDSGSMDFCLRRSNYDFEAAIKLYYKIHSKRIVPLGRASKESLIYFIPLYKKLRKLGINRNDIYFGVGGSNEYFLADGANFFLYDFTILSKKIIIEYDGLYWHSKSKDIINDKLKTDLAISKNFSLLRISSIDSIEKNIIKINNFINEKI